MQDFYQHCCPPQFVHIFLTRFSCNAKLLCTSIRHEYSAVKRLDFSNQNNSDVSSICYVPFATNLLFFLMLVLLCTWSKANVISCQISAMHSIYLLCIIWLKSVFNHKSHQISLSNNKSHCKFIQISLSNNELHSKFTNTACPRKSGLRKIPTSGPPKIFTNVTQCNKVLYQSSLVYVSNCHIDFLLLAKNRNY